MVRTHYVASAIIITAVLLSILCTVMVWVLVSLFD